MTIEEKGYEILRYCTSRACSPDCKLYSVVSECESCCTQNIERNYAILFGGEKIVEAKPIEPTATEDAPIETKREHILNTAIKMVCGHREQDYGSPENSFSLIADLWTAYLGEPISSVDVAMMMALLKIARIKGGTGTEDSFVDLAGYAACGGEIAGCMG